MGGANPVAWVMRLAALPVGAASFATYTMSNYYFQDGINYGSFTGTTCYYTKFVS